MKALSKLYWPVLIAASLLMLVALGLVFFFAPVESTMGIVQKIFYVHVPAAMCAYAGFTITSAASLFYLLKPKKGWDIAAQTGVELGLLFTIYVLVSGPLWALKAWGKAWTWDPQLTATFVLFLLYGGYFMLRAFSQPTERIKKISAVLAVFSFVDIPIIHYAVRKWGGLHPVVEREGGQGLAPDIASTFQVSMLASLLLFTILFWIAIRIRLRRARVEELFLEVEDITRSRA